MMRRVLESSRYLIMIAVVSLLFASLATFVWGAFKTVSAMYSLFATQSGESFGTIYLIELMDVFLIATALYIFAVGLYELFIGDINLPEWLVIHNIHDLKAKLSSIIVLVMAAKFVKRLVEGGDPYSILFAGISVTLVSGALIAFGHFGGKD